MEYPVYGATYDFYIVLPDVITQKARVNPTIAAGDFKISLDGGALNNLTNLPTVSPAGGRIVKISLTAAENTCKKWVIQCVDAAGDEWDENYLDGTTINNASAGIIAYDVNVINWKGSAAPAMTGDAYARLGAPTGASVSADIADLDTEIDGLVTKTGTPAVSVSADIAAVKADCVTIKGYTDTLESVIGSPAGASVSADIAAVKADCVTVKGYTDTLEGVLGTPVGVSMSADIAAIETKLGTPAGVSVSADIAAVKADCVIVKGYTDTLESTIGAPAGASVSADIAAVKADCVTLKGYTDTLEGVLGTPAGVSVSADIAAMQTKLGTPAGVSVSVDIAAVKVDTGSIAGKLPSNDIADGHVLEMVQSDVSDILNKMPENIIPDSEAVAAIAADVTSIVNKLPAGDISDQTTTEDNNSKLVSLLEFMPGIGPVAAKGDTDALSSQADSNRDTILIEVEKVVSKLPAGTISDYDVNNTSIDGVTIKNINKMIMAMFDGKFVVDQNAGTITFYNRDNVTILTVVKTTEAGRSRV